MGRQQKMSEGRKTQIVLLDERRLEILIQPKLYAGELLDIVASHFNLKEKEYFGLAFKDETGHFHWLQLDRKVLEHDFPKKGGPLILFFSVRFFIESIGYLRDNVTIELFYLQAKQAIFKDHVESDSDTAFELAAYVLQATYGDFEDEEIAKRQLKKLPVLPTSALKEHPSISYCEDQVIAYYTKIAGQTRGSAIVNYMTIVESLPTYGIHYYEVKDKSGIPWWLGISHRGISQYDFSDKRIPRRVFAWKQLENLYFRDKKFSIEVHDPKRVSVSRRTFGPGNVNVHAWFASNPQLTKCIWSMAVSQHQFYLDRKQSKSHLPTSRSMSEIAADLCQSTSSLPSSASGDISRSNSAHSLTISTCNVKFDLDPEELEASRAAQRDMYAALQARREALEDALLRKTEELKAICMKEAELTGCLPPELPIEPGDDPPPIRRRVGTGFSLSPKIINRDRASEETELTKLELEFELQDKIVKAALRLAHDASVTKSMRKQRRASYNKATQKLKDLEKRLNDARKHLGKGPVKTASTYETDSEFSSPVNSPAIPRSHLTKEPQVKIITSPKVEVVELEHPESLDMSHVATAPHNLSAPTMSSAPDSPAQLHRSASTPSPNPPRSLERYQQNSVYNTRTQYRNQMYPTYRSQSTSSNQSEYDNLAAYTSSAASNRRQETYQEAMHNLYNVHTTQTTRYDSADELKSEDEDTVYNEEMRRMHLPSKHGSLDGAYKRRSKDYGDHYGSLERNYSDSIILPELTPSRFGSKRESTSDYRDSIYQPVEMPPLPGDSDTDSSSFSHSGSSTHEMPPPYRDSPHGYHGYHHGHGDYGRDGHVYGGSTHSTHSSNNSAVMGPGGHWHEKAEASHMLRQQAPPHTPQYEVAPQTFVQEQHAASYEHNMPPDAQQQMTTVTKYQSFVEVSKPFEMSDFYKYSERLRKQRKVQLRQHKMEEVLSGSTLSISQSGDDGRESGASTPALGQTASYVTSPGSLSPGSSQGRAASPYGAHQQRDSSPAYTGIPGPAPYQTARSRHSYGVQNMLSSSSYHAQSSMTTFHASSSSSSLSSSSSRHVPYSPLQPMTCEPLKDSPSGPPQGGSTPNSQRLLDSSIMEGRTPKELASFDADQSLGTAFTDEMMAWYDDRDPPPAPGKASTLV